MCTIATKLGKAVTELPLDALHAGGYFIVPAWRTDHAADEIQQVFFDHTGMQGFASVAAQEVRAYNAKTTTTPGGPTAPRKKQRGAAKCSVTVNGALGHFQVCHLLKNGTPNQNVEPQNCDKGTTNLLKAAIDEGNFGKEAQPITVEHDRRGTTTLRMKSEVEGEQIGKEKN